MIVTGSSPLTRGKRLAARSGYDPGGLIPAHAGKTRSRICSESAPAAHPRSRGENISRSKLDTSLIGSSPLTRGKRPPGSPRPQLPRLIPAHAGKTVQQRRGGKFGGAHPRSRGENLPGTRNSPPSRGSSPLTRGKRPPGSPRPQLPRLIPAHAGKTVQQRRGGKFGGAHPRSRGENESAGDARHNHGRLIPAHAGKTRQPAALVF